MYTMDAATYNEMVEARNREIEWYGTITLTNGSEIEFDKSNLSQSVGELKKTCSDASSIGIGGVYASELTFQLQNIEIDRFLLYDGVIELYSNVSYASIGTPTWAGASAYTWGALSSYTWNNIIYKKTLTFPMGKFIIKEAMRTADKIKVTAYDFMVLFDKDIPEMDVDARTPHRWLDLACTTCGVTYGMESSKIFALPNGRRLVKFANSDNTVKTWRDVVASAAAAMGANAYISRSGALMIGSYNYIIADAIDTGRRYSSDFSDYQSYYTGIYLNYKEEGIREYQTNADSAAEDTGLSYDLGDNCFLQVSDETERAAMLKAIIDRQKGLSYAPFKVSIPFNPAYDLMDTLVFTGNQADPSNDIAPITSMVIRIGGKMDISCGGENPALITAESKETKALNSISGSSYNENLWMNMKNGPASNTTIPANTETYMGLLHFNSDQMNTMIQVCFTASYVLSKTALVTGTVYVDDEPIYVVKQNQWVGDNKLTITTGYELYGDGHHGVYVTLKVEESTLDIGGGGVLSQLNVMENGVYRAADEGVYGFSQATVNVNDLLGYYVSATSAEAEANEAYSEWQDSASYVVTAVYGHASTQAVCNTSLSAYAFEASAVKVQE